jgi:hypothetical protein
MNNKRKMKKKTQNKKTINKPDQKKKRKIVCETSSPK